MLNSYYIGGDTTNVKCEVNLNAPSSGFIQKSNPVSRFIRFQRGSNMEKKLFPTDPRENPKLVYEEIKRVEGDYFSTYKTWEEKEVTILQVCIFGQDYYLAEYVFNEDLK